jgi:hypothetical protein
MKTEDLLQFDAELRAIRQALPVALLEAVFPPALRATQSAIRPATPPHRSVRERSTPFVSCSQGPQAARRLSE